MSITVIKRDGSYEDFNIDKVTNSIMAAAYEVDGDDEELAAELADIVYDIIETNEINCLHSQDIQNIIEKTLIEEGHAATAKEYILRAADRNRIREMDSSIMRSLEEITFSSNDSSNDIKKENANIDSNTAMGTMLKYGSESAKKFNTLYLMSRDIANAHINGDIHIHDIDFLSLTFTCCQIPLDVLFKNGFNTGHGFLREPGNIRTAAALAAIAIQSNQNDQHGGQSIPMFDYYLAPYVALSYAKNIAHIAKIRLDLNSDTYKELRKQIISYKNKHNLIMGDNHEKQLRYLVTKSLKDNEAEFNDKDIDIIFKHAYNDTYNDTFQAMEAFIHNLNTMHVRQVQHLKDVA